MISYDDALKATLAYADKMRSELSVKSVGLSDSLGKTLADDIYSEEALPGFTNSAMDGYGIARSDIRESCNLAEEVFEVIGESSAGLPFEGEIEPGRHQACRIMTGALVPPGVDTVVKVEDSDREIAESGFVRFSAIPDTGANIRLAGEDLPTGRKISASGQIIGPKEILLYATLGVRKLPVYEDLLAAIVSTGSELCEGSDAPDLRQGQIRNSTSPYLEASLRISGINSVECTSVADKPDKMISHFNMLFSKGYPVILTTGGVSAGKHDYLPTVIKDLGGEILFHKVAIRPGKPLLVAHFPGDRPERSTMVFCLPGNPVSTMTGFQFFVKPYLKRLLGQLGQAGILLALGDTVSNQTGLTRFIRAQTVSSGDGGLSVKPMSMQGSHMVGQLSKMDCWIQLKPEQRLVQKGESVLVRFQEKPDFV